LPGGKGAAVLAKSPEVKALLIEQQKMNRHTAAICGAPAVVLEPLGLLKDHNFCCYPSFNEKLPNADKHSRVVVSGKYITSVGPGSGIEFALKIIEVLVDAPAAEKMRRELCARE